jgi:hypothetical protein
MTRRVRVSAVVLVGLLVASAGPAGAHSPDPTLGGALYDQNQDLAYRWLAGEVPPSKMQTPINAGAGDANASRGSRAPTLRYSTGGASTVEYGTSVFCGVNGLACADRAGAPDSFRVAFREHGHRFDWGTLRWCQMQDSFTNGCYDVENVALDEFGHILVLDHHVNYADERDYLDAVVQRVSRVRPEDGWNAHVFARCDVATLQIKYDMQTWESLYSTCLNLSTKLTISASTTSVFAGDVVNPVSARTVILQRRVPGSATWTSIGAMTPAYGGVYRLDRSIPATYDWRATFATPAKEGINGSNSPAVRVTVLSCGSPCPNAAPVDTRH